MLILPEHFILLFYIIGHEAGFVAVFAQHGFVQFGPHFLIADFMLQAFFRFLVHCFSAVFFAQHGLVQLGPHFFSVAFFAQQAFLQSAAHFFTSVLLEEHHPHEEHPVTLPTIKSIAPTTIPNVKNLDFILKLPVYCYCLS